MALISCPECKKEISDKAEACLSCGYKLKKQKKVEIINPELASDKKLTNIAAIFIGAIVIAILKMIGLSGILVTIIVYIFTFYLLHQFYFEPKAEKYGIPLMVEPAPELREKIRQSQLNKKIIYWICAIIIIVLAVLIIV